MRRPCGWNPRYDGKKEGCKGLLKRAKQHSELFVREQLLKEGFVTKIKGFDDNHDDEDNEAASVKTLRSEVYTHGGNIIDLETRQSINRAACLSSVLLPFSIIAATCLMCCNFQPGGYEFFIFWILAISMCLVTTAFICADSIRRMTLEQSAQQYRLGAVKGEVDAMVACSILESENISYKASFREGLAS